MQPPLVVEPSAPVRACVIWLHGLGADGHDFEPIVPELRLPQEMGVRFVFPHAPYRPVTINGGYVMRAWYDIVSSDLQFRPDLEGMAESQRLLEELLAQQLEQGVALQRLVLAGFSQGGVIALQTALQMAVKPAGVLALSTYLAQRQGDGSGLAVFQAHGTQDPVVPLQAGLQARTALLALGAEVDWREYPMPHAVHPNEVADIGRWLRERLQD
jgi:phospholipase/carboxylesterase